MVDFTKFTDEDLISYFQKIKGRGTCGVYRQDQVVTNAPVSRSVFKHFYSRVFLLIAGVFSYSISKAQIVQNIKGNTSVSPTDNSSKTMDRQEFMDIIGTVVSADEDKSLQVKKDEPLNGAPIKVKGSSKGTVTDIDGNFKLTHVPIGSIIEISYSGFKTQEMKIDSRKTEYNFSLKITSEIFTEVVVTGYGTHKVDTTRGQRVRIHCEPIQEIKENNFFKEYLEKIKKF